MAPPSLPLPPTTCFFFLSFLILSHYIDNCNLCISPPSIPHFIFSLFLCLCLFPPLFSNTNNYHLFSTLTSLFLSLFTHQKVSKPIMSNNNYNKNNKNKNKDNSSMSTRHVPKWLQVLLKEKFYNACVVHQHDKKNEKNVYCLDCCLALCPHCLSPHPSHRLLQIRRYVYHDVIRLDDAAKLFDCTSVQAYTTNSAKVVFIKERAQTRNFRGSGNFCNTCDRTLQPPYHFCSLSCKINYLLGTKGGLSGYLYECNYLSLPETGFEECVMTPNSVLEPSGSLRTSSGSGGCGGVDCMTTLACTATTTEVVRKKRTGSLGSRPVAPACGPIVENTAGLMNRRKGTPHRAPLH